MINKSKYGWIEFFIINKDEDEQLWYDSYEKKWCYALDVPLDDNENRYTEF